MKDMIRHRALSWPVTNTDYYKYTYPYVLFWCDDQGDLSSRTLFHIPHILLVYGFEGWDELVQCVD